MKNDFLYWHGKLINDMVIEELKDALIAANVIIKHQREKLEVVAKYFNH